jgi:hypothetical protein
MVTTQRQPKQLGQILLEQGLISGEHLQRALDEHRNTPKSPGRVLIDLGYIRERDLVDRARDVHAPRRRAPQGRIGHHLYRRDRKVVK